MFFLSVIIPVYKVEKYLRNCIESVISQKLRNTEIILVDDGSPDSCPEICDEYSEKYSFVKVFHKQNGGLSSARNAGLEIATGEYVMFLDSDDWWNPEVNMQKVLEKVDRNPDVDMFLLTSLDYIEDDGYYKRKEHENLKKIDTSTVESYYRDLLVNGNLEVHAATKILKREFLNKHNLVFKEGIISEDNEWILRLLRYLKRVIIIDEPLYVYRAGRVGSITNSVKLKNVSDVLDIIKSSIYYYNLHKNASLKKYELCYCAYLWFSALGLSNQLNQQDRKKLKNAFKKTSFVCAYSNSPKTRLAYRVYKIFGLNITTVILGKYIALKGSKNINKRKVDN